MEKRAKKGKRICLFGHFGASNFGNDSTLLATLIHLRRLLPEAKIVCACTGPERLVETHDIEAVPINGRILKRWAPSTPLTAMLKRVIIGLPTELCSLQALRTLRSVDVLIIPGTGLLTDAYMLTGWGPFNLLKWSLIARMCGCKIIFASVGAGPVYSALGKYLVKSALSWANFRSYRDSASVECLERIGFRASSDRIYPDLAFSLPEAMLPRGGGKRGRRPVVGLGVMAYAGKYSIANPEDSIYREYLNSLVAFARWLMAHDYDIRLIIGDGCDTRAVEEFKSLLTASLGAHDEERIVDQPAISVEKLLHQIAETDIIVATRFHNVLLAFLLNKPVIAISFHHKCTSLMSQMGLEKYCLDINHMNGDELIEQFQDVERNVEKLKSVIRQEVERSRDALDEQYSLIFKSI